MNSFSIRPAKPADFDFVFQLYMHPAVNPYLLYEPMEQNQFEPVFNALLNSSVKYIFSIDNLPIGMFKLIPLTHRTAHVCYLGGVAIDPLYKAKGYGQKMLESIIEFATAQGFLRIELSVAITNEKALSLYKKVGFKKEGVLEKYGYLESEDKFIDEVVMAYLL